MNTAAEININVQKTDRKTNTQEKNKSLKGKGSLPSSTEDDVEEKKDTAGNLNDLIHRRAFHIREMSFDQRIQTIHNLLHLVQFILLRQRLQSSGLLSDVT